MENKELFEKVKDEAGNILTNVAQKTEYLAKSSTLKLTKGSHKASIKTHFKNIGRYVYENQDKYKDNAFIKEQLEHINQLEAKIEEIKEKLEGLKKEQIEKNRAEAE
ncbi:MAG: hypothetical protein KGY74_04770 [Candidatus Cloacimonetes bacterium]|nr:hypothetical protein [Candidatus Cloacimonadota bacterium]